MSVLTVAKYLPERLYGFLRQEDGSEVFFHLGDFDCGPWIEPPPIIGEQVEAEIDSTMVVGKAPKARTVKRIHAPEKHRGSVDTFNAEKGWGFVKSDEGVSFYLHRSEVLRGKVPMAGQRVRFYAGFKNDRPRACYVSIEDKR